MKWNFTQNILFINSRPLVRLDVLLSVMYAWYRKTICDPLLVNVNERLSIQHIMFAAYSTRCSLPLCAAWMMLRHTTYFAFTSSVLVFVWLPVTLASFLFRWRNMKCIVALMWWIPTNTPRHIEYSDIHMEWKNQNNGAACVCVCAGVRVRVCARWT